MSSSPIWSPSPERIRNSLLHAFMQRLERELGLEFSDYASLHAWSVEYSDLFWHQLWRFAGVIGHRGGTTVADSQDAEHAVWFPDARLNFAENLLMHERVPGESPAIIARSENGSCSQLSWHELQQQVAAVSAWLRHAGVQEGDVVAGFMPNIPETVVAMLATATLGGIWTSCSPDFGSEGVIERFGQTQPKVLFAADGYDYNGKQHHSRERAAAIMTAIGSITHRVEVSCLEPSALPAGVTGWREILATHRGSPLTFHSMPFNAPLYVLYSSGTTGKPKCIVHSAGGTLLNHFKEHLLHCDIQPGDPVFYFTTCGWMMWNWLASSLACGATLLLYDGAPLHPDAGRLWQWLAEQRISLFGTSANYLEVLEKSGLKPGRQYHLGALRTLCSTGSPLAPEQFDFVYRHIRRDLLLASISGGTDICGCFVLGNPISPVYRGQCQGPGLGLNVQVFDDNGRRLFGQPGELVCCNAFPNRPLGFWNDNDGSRYHHAYWARWPGVWQHGDFVTQTAEGGMVFHGRSDAVLNPGGVRIGTAEIYRQLAQFREIAGSVIIGQRKNNDERLVLFVQLAGGHSLTPELSEAIRKQLRTACSPRHVPAVILEVSDIPRTRSGKLVELAVREVVHNRPVKNMEALANPDALEQFKNRPELA
ncbi:acetoacetate--CoA ligase [Oceanimonas baumannii]|uniref:Acetoacetate--CoA ligase n=1 Tax=Oceanimonas baumannii TaxID=129578 RepID=A0A235CLG4_9GAMM|nr:acetoacetate--CoA ligase [Oceanimonas baumannii]OYD25380.1 acetoacetate--CoA ligase [Oceanimonas baumannii]TDW61428.1 acetoacetyl-CoA synthetase [Oceanimonas baumannii]